jgi:hypothetical protein
MKRITRLIGHKLSIFLALTIVVFLLLWSYEIIIHLSPAFSLTGFCSSNITVFSVSVSGNNLFTPGDVFALYRYYSKRKKGTRTWKTNTASRGHAIERAG